LLKRLPDEAIKDSRLTELAEEFSWVINRISMSDGSWGLESKASGSEILSVTEKTKGFINSFSFTGVEAEYLSRTLPTCLENSDDSYELTNWSGELALKKNGKFVA
jgi:hypothetical protein